MTASKSRTLTASLTIVLALAAAACGGEDPQPMITGDPAPPTTEAEETEETEETTEGETEGDAEETEDVEPATGDDMSMAAGPQGEACAEIFQEELDGDQPWADLRAAATFATNPRFSVLSQLVTEAGLVETLNDDGPYTVFAPIDAAFDEVPEDQLDALLADEEQLNEVLLYHVVEGEALDAAALMETDSVETVSGEALPVEAADSSVSVGDATVVCANVEVQNGVVHFIDTVLMP